MNPSKIEPPRAGLVNLAGAQQSCRHTHHVGVIVVNKRLTKMVSALASAPPSFHWLDRPAANAVPVKGDGCLSGATPAPPGKDGPALPMILPSRSPSRTDPLPGIDRLPRRGNRPWSKLGPARGKGPCCRNPLQRRRPEP